MEVKDIYNVLAIANNLELIQMNHEKVLNYTLEPEFLMNFDTEREGESLIWALADLVEARILHPGSLLSAKYPDYKVHRVTQLEHFISKSGNPTWMACDDEGDVIYLRQVNKALLEEAGLWDTLNLMPVGAEWECEIFIHTTKDGDFRKPVQIDVLGRIDVPLNDVAKKELEEPHPPALSPSGEGEQDKNDLLPDMDDVPFDSTPEIEQPAHEISGIQWADELMGRRDWVILDTETSHIDGYPIEVAVVSPEGEVLFNQRVKLPEGITIDPGAMAVHGITMDDLKDCKEWPEFASDFAEVIKNKTVVIYNARFDTAIINRVNAHYGIPHHLRGAVCAMEAYAEYKGDWNDYHGNYRWVKLVDAARQMKVQVKDTHSALGDCLMTLGVIKALAAKAKVQADG